MPGTGGMGCFCPELPKRAVAKGPFKEAEETLLNRSWFSPGVVGAGLHLTGHLWVANSGASPTCPLSEPVA